MTWVIKKMTPLSWAVIFFALLILDRLFKSLAAAGLETELVREFFKFTLAKNYYMAFSLPFYGDWLNVLISAIIIGLIYWLIILGRIGRPAVALGLTTVVLGASSNLFDRLKYGYVIDYLDLKYFTTFNLADIMIVGGTIYLLVNIKKQTS